MPFSTELTPPAVPRVRGSRGEAVRGSRGEAVRLPDCSAAASAGHEWSAATTAGWDSIQSRGQQIQGGFGQGELFNRS